MNTKLSTLRIGRNWSQEYVAEQIGITQPAYSKLESGLVRLTVDRAQQLATLYEIEPEFFFSNDATVIHNNGHCYSSNSYNGSVTNFPNYMESQKDLYEKVIADKDKELMLLKSEIISLKADYKTLVDKIADKL